MTRARSVIVMCRYLTSFEPYSRLGFPHLDTNMTSSYMLRQVENHGHQTHDFQLHVSCIDSSVQPLKVTSLKMGMSCVVLCILRIPYTQQGYHGSCILQDPAARCPLCCDVHAEKFNAEESVQTRN